MGGRQVGGFPTARPLSAPHGFSGVPVSSPDSSQRLAMTVSACLLDGQALSSSLDLIRQAAEALTADRPVMLPPGHRDPAHHAGLVADLAIPKICASIPTTLSFFDGNSASSANLSSGARRFTNRSVGRTCQSQIL